MKNKMSNSTPEEMSKTEENSSKITEHKEEPHSNESDTQQQNALNVAFTPNQVYQPVAPQYAGYIQIQTPTNETIDVGVIPSNTTLSWQADHQIPAYQYINYNYPANYPSLVPVDYINTYTAAPNANNPPYNNPTGANDSQAMSNNNSVDYFSRDKLRASTTGYAYQYAPAANEHIYTSNPHFQHSQSHLADNNMYNSFNYSYYTKNSHKESSKFRSNPSFKNKNKYSSYNNNHNNNSNVQVETNGFENSLQQQVEQEQKQEQPHKWSDVVKKNKSPLSSSSSTSTTANHKNQDETAASTNNNNSSGVSDLNDGNEAAVKSNKYADNKPYYNPAKPKYNKSHYYNNNYSFNSYPYSQYGLDGKLCFEIEI